MIPCGHETKVPAKPLAKTPVAFLGAVRKSSSVFEHRESRLLARTNHKCAVWVIGLLDIKPNDKVLEVGFGPGLGIQFAAGLTSRDM